MSGPDPYSIGAKSMTTTSKVPPVSTDSLIVAEPWTKEALCAQTDPEAFFPEKGGSTRDAKKICGACPVPDECLEYAMRMDQRYGIWGGLSERERRKLRRPNLTPEQETVLRDMSDRLATNREIAEVMGLTALTIGQYRRALRLPTAPAGRPTNGAVA